MHLAFRLFSLLFIKDKSILAKHMSRKYCTEGQYLHTQNHNSHGSVFMTKNNQIGFVIGLQSKLD